MALKSYVVPKLESFKLNMFSLQFFVNFVFYGDGIIYA